ncbi:hypothetical protein AGMMS50239_24900 [Bacteroidia bacterium]|nr:hypothetical protein AGMMS50239_24900 [Bacteroidia bacterium]
MELLGYNKFKMILFIKNIKNMKTKIFGGIAVLALVAVAAINMNLGTKDNHLSDISLENRDALANEEGENSSDTCGTSMSYEFRQELCGSGSSTTSLSIMCYSCTTGASNQCQEGCNVTGFGCNGYVNTSSVTNKPC